MERPRGRRAGLLWAVLVSPALTADRIGLNEPRALWRQPAAPAVIGVAVDVARRRPRRPSRRWPCRASPRSRAWARRPTNLAGVLPERAVRDVPVERAPGPSSRDSDCRRYRASGELVVSVDHLRLRLDNSGRLVARDLIPRAGLSQHSSTDAEFAR